jgi:hypothetical protein
MSVRPCKDEPGWRTIDYYPLGRKGKRIRRQIQGREAEAREIEAALRRQTVSRVGARSKIVDVVSEFLDYYKNNYPATTYRDCRYAM